MLKITLIVFCSTVNDNVAFTLFLPSREIKLFFRQFVTEDIFVEPLRIQLKEVA